jgi:hypothetical protein
MTFMRATKCRASGQFIMWQKEVALSVAGHAIPKISVSFFEFIAKCRTSLAELISRNLNYKTRFEIYVLEIFIYMQKIYTKSLIIHVCGGEIF